MTKIEPAILEQIKQQFNGVCPVCHRQGDLYLRQTTSGRSIGHYYYFKHGDESCYVDAAVRKMAFDIKTGMRQAKLEM